MASKTREKLIEVARQLFIRNGVDNTTIGDIANASDKGRRTIYTYFKNKKEIYRAVIESESDNMVSELREITFSDLKPTDKLKRFFELKLAQIRQPHSSTLSLKSLIRVDFRRSELVRKKAYEKEEALIMSILKEGIDSGEFNEEKCCLLMEFSSPLLRGIDLLSYHDDFAAPNEVKMQAFLDFLAKSLI